MPFELVVERFCRKYGYTPDQVLELDYDWITTFNAIATFDKESQARKRTLNKIDTTVKQHGR